jgi:hypothetical protein
MCEVYEDHCLARAFWDMSEGKLPVLKPHKDGPWMAEVVLCSQWYDKNWLHIEVPSSVRQWVKLKDYCVKKGELFCIPNENGGYFGNVVAIGNTPQVAIDKVMKRAEMVKACELEIKTDVFDGATKQLRLMKKYGLL